MAYTTSHLVALMTRLANETVRHGDNPDMQVYLNGIRKEIEDEENFLEARGVSVYRGDDCDMSDDELFAELGI